MSMSPRGALLVAAALGLGPVFGAGSPGVQIIPKGVLQQQQPRRNKRGSIFSGRDALTLADTRRSARGWSNRQVQRMAVKNRNQARHRVACRGGKRSRA